jgi:hypothetical protein
MNWSFNAREKNILRERFWLRDQREAGDKKTSRLRQNGE